MTNFEVKRDGNKFILDITGVRHVFVTEDETCVEIELTLSDIRKMESAVINGKKLFKPWDTEA